MDRKHDNIVWDNPQVVQYVQELPLPYLDPADRPYHPSFFGAQSNCLLPWRHRFLVLISGRITTKMTLQCEHKVEKLRSASHTYVHWPLWCAKVLGVWNLVKAKWQYRRIKRKL